MNSDDLFKEADEAGPVNGPAKPRFTMLTTAVEGRFSNAVRVPLDDACEGSIFLLRAITPRKLKEWAAKFGICQTCGGRGLTKDDSGQLHNCVRCGGKARGTWLDPEVRRGMLSDFCLGWENVVKENMETREQTECLYSDEMRDTLSDTGVFDAAFDAAVKLATRVRDEQEKN